MMFGIGIRYLNGWAMAAADGPKKEQAEWPPHPDRVFMALAAAWFETGEDPDEGDALKWLEGLDPPEIAASDATYRRIVKTYVPVNDSSKPITKKGKAEQSIGFLPIGRHRAERSFPVAIPHDPVVHLIWPSTDISEHRDALARLTRKVVFIGHSASLVQVWATETPPRSRWRPVDGVASHRLRVFGPKQKNENGRLEYLKMKCDPRPYIAKADDIWRGEQQSAGRRATQLKTKREAILSGINDRLRPAAGRWQGYGRPVSARPDTPRSLFDPRLLVLDMSGRKLELRSTLKLTAALRGALLSSCKPPIPEWLSAHGQDGAPTKQPHMALIPLPFVGREHADGRLMGAAIVLPQAVDPIEAAQNLEPLIRKENGQIRPIKLFRGVWLECDVKLETRESPPWSLQPQSWVRPSRTWASVTPVVLDRHFDGADTWEKAAESVKDAVTRIGLPRPNEVLLSPFSIIEGVPRSNEFPWLTRKKDGGRMQHAHVVIVFEGRVCGPMLVGAGRFRGYGLCRPMDSKEKHDE